MASSRDEINTNSRYGLQVRRTTLPQGNRPSLSTPSENNSSLALVFVD